MPGAPHSDEEIEAAIQALMEPGRLERAQRVAESAAPQLQSILNAALSESDYFGPTHRHQVLQAAGVADPDERLDAVARLISEETRIAMLVGVAVGMELAAELGHTRED